MTAETGMRPVPEGEQTPEEPDDAPAEPVIEDPDGVFPEEGDTEYGDAEDVAP